MKRETLPSRENWQERCTEVGFDYFDLPSSDGSMYWSDDVAYHFTTAEVDSLDDATLELHQMSMEFVNQTVSSGDYPAQFGLTQANIELIEASWKNKEPSLFGRFDLAYDGQHIKMLEYNADTPTSLLEASVVQWDWLVDRGLPDQFNSLHEKLIERFKYIKSTLPVAFGNMIHFAGMQEAGREDWGNIEYLMECAYQAGFNVSELPIESLGWDSTKSNFVDLNMNTVHTCFKLYPWEWLKDDEFAKFIPQSGMRWIEPAWKMLLSSKALLPMLWKSYSGHPLLLEAEFLDENAGGFHKSGSWVKKPILSREGANVSKLFNGVEQNLAGSEFVAEYDHTGYIVQKWVDLPVFDGFRPIIGSWVVGNETAGMGLREDYNVVTGNDSHFIPHYFSD